MDRLIWALMVVVDCVLNIRLTQTLFGNIRFSKRKIILVCLIFMAIFYVDTNIKISVLPILPMISIFILANDKNVFLKLLIICVFSMLSQQVASLLIGNSFIYRSSFLKISDFVYVALMIMLIILVDYVKKKLYLSWKDIPFYTYINFALGVFAGLFPLDIVRLFESQIPSRFKNSILHIGYIAIILNVISIYLFIRNYQQKNYYNQQSKEKSILIQSQEKYLEETIRNYESLRNFRHDIKGHLRHINHLSKDNKEIQGYLNELTDCVKSSEIFNCSNIELSAILSSLGTKLKEENIHYHFDYSVNGNIKIEKLDLCSLFFNLTDNIYEAEMKLKDIERNVSIQISNIYNHLMITIVNDIDEYFDIGNLIDKKTTKQDKENHGIGLQNIERIVNKYLGTIDYSVENNLLKTEILLQDVVELE